MMSEEAAGLWQRSQSMAAHSASAAASTAATLGAGLGDASPPSPTPGVDWRRAVKAVRSALAQQRLALREYREAVRLRPRNTEVRQRFERARAVLRGLQEALKVPKAIPLGRFVAHYNLSIRYWDLGKAGQALAQAELACKELRNAGLELGCAEHNLIVIEREQAKHRQTERQLVEAVQRTPQAIGPNYGLAELYFDKRMLHRAEVQLKKTRDLARSASSLQLLEHERLQKLQESGERPWWETLDGKKVRRLSGLLEGLEDDLSFLTGLRQLWCVEEESGKAERLQDTGVRDSARPQLLVCLHQRFSQDACQCETWWAGLCGRADVDLRALPTSGRRTPAGTRSRSGSVLRPPPRR